MYRFTPLSARVLPIEPVAADRLLRRSPYMDSNHRDPFTGLKSARTPPIVRLLKRRYCLR